MRRPFYTPVRRNHIVGPLGVGSIVVSRSGVTVLMTGLDDWVRVIKANGPDEVHKNKNRQERMSAYELHDFALENTLGVQRFIQPPIIEDGEADTNTWFIPSMRFPLAEYCTSPWCSAITFARTAEDHLLAHAQSLTVRSQENLHGKRSKFLWSFVVQKAIWMRSIGTPKFTMVRIVYTRNSNTRKPPMVLSLRLSVSLAGRANILVPREEVSRSGQQNAAVGELGYRKVRTNLATKK